MFGLSGSVTPPDYNGGRCPTSMPCVYYLTLPPLCILCPCFPMSLHRLEHHRCGSLVLYEVCGAPECSRYGTNERREPANADPQPLDYQGSGSDEPSESLASVISVPATSINGALLLLPNVVPSTYSALRSTVAPTAKPSLATSSVDIRSANPLNLRRCLNAAGALDTHEMVGWRRMIRDIPSNIWSLAMLDTFKPKSDNIIAFLI